MKKALKRADFNIFKDLISLPGLQNVYINACINTFQTNKKNQL